MRRDERLKFIQRENFGVRQAAYRTNMGAGVRMAADRTNFGARQKFVNLYELCTQERPNCVGLQIRTCLDRILVCYSVALQVMVRRVF